VVEDKVYRYAPTSKDELNRYASTLERDYYCDVLALEDELVQEKQVVYAYDAQ
jgi:hypothetical protein